MHDCGTDESGEGVEGGVGEVLLALALGAKRLPNRMVGRAGERIPEIRCGGLKFACAPVAEVIDRQV